MADAEFQAPLADVHFPAQDDYLTPEEVRSLTPAILRERILALKPLIAARARETELARRPLDDTMNLLRKTGIFYMFVPKKYGGLELGLEDLIDIMMPVGEACASTGWVTTFCIEHNLIFAHWPPEAQDAIFGKQGYIMAPAPINPPGFAMPVEGGYRISGHWRWASGVMNADWIFLSAIILREEGDPNTPSPGPLPPGMVPLPGGAMPEMVHFIVPAKEATVLDVWHMMGMSGTGSNDVTLQDHFVPELHVNHDLSFMAGAGWGSRLYDNPIYRVPLFTLLSLTTMIPAIGAAKTAVAIYRDSFTKRSIAGSFITLVDKPAAQVRLARADLMVRTAEITLRDTVRQMMEMATNRQGADLPWRASIRAQNCYSMELCRKAVQSIAEAGGSSAANTALPLQRILRDISVMSTHVLYDGDVAYELHGRGQIGLPPNNMVI